MQPLLQPILFASERGLPTLRLGDVPLEDPIDPVEGAHAFANADQVSRDHVVVFGAGLGYRLARLQELGCDAPVVFEPSADVLRLAQTHGPGIPAAASVFTELADLHRHLAAVSKADERTILLAAPAYQRAFPDQYRSLVAVLDEVQGIAILKRNTLGERSAMLVERAISNLPRLRDVPTIDSLGAPLDGVPAFIVSAGPSLDRNRHLIEEASRRGAVFAVNTSAPALAAIGAPIDLLVAIEALDVSEPIRAAANVTRALALDLTANGANFEVPIARKTSFLVDVGQFHALGETLGTSRLAYGGSVATAAFALALRLGADPIVMLGQDLAYTDGRGYATDTLYDETSVTREGPHLLIERASKQIATMQQGGLRVPGKRRPCVDVPAWGSAARGDGSTVWSTHELVLFRRWFEEAARHYRGRVRLINATEGGASIEGFEERAMADLLEELPVRTHGLHDALDRATPLAAAQVDAARRAVRDSARKIATCAARAERAAARGAVPTKMAEAVRRAAADAPLVDAHATGALLDVMDDRRLTDGARARRTYGAIAASARRVAELAG